jgi:drug/metabolite transporter (DMT)-like permease
MFYVLALSSAALYGAADFLGGLASRRASAIAVVALSQFAGLLALVFMLPFLPPATPARGDWIWGGAAGLAGGAGVALLYRALAIGTMAVVAPITAVCAVTIPVAAAIAFGERPGALTFAGIVLAMIAIVLVSQGEGAKGTSAVPTGRPPRGAGTALASGVAIGLFFLALAETGAGAGMWPLVAARGVSFGLFGGIAVVLRLPMRMPSQVTGLAVAGGVLDMLANLLYLVATRRGPLSVVVTLSSLYPVSTVVLARTVLGERLSWRQIVGIACALVAVVVIVSTRQR